MRIDEIASETMLDMLAASNINPGVAGSLRAEEAETKGQADARIADELADLSISDLTNEQLKKVSINMANGSDGWEAGRKQDWEGVRDALREAVRDGYSIGDFLA